MSHFIYVFGMWKTGSILLQSNVYGPLPWHEKLNRVMMISRIIMMKWSILSER